MAFSWKKLGSLYNKSGEKTKSLAAYDSAAYYYTITKDSARLRDLLSDIGDVYYNDQQYQKAFATYFKWHQLNLTNKNKSDLANSFYQLANASFSFNVDTSKFYYTSCYKTAKDIGDKSNELYANLGLGYVSYRQYDYAAGEKYFTDALSLAIKDKNKKQEANCYKMIASAYSTKLDFDKALLFYNKAITLYDSIGEKTSIPSLYNYVANALQTKGDFNEAKKWYTQSIELAVKVNNKSDIGYAYSGLSFLYVLQGDLESAQKTADSSKAIFRELNNSWQIANSYITMGIVSNYKNDYENSVNYYLAADSLFQIEKDDWSRSTCQNNIGNVYYFQTDYDKSLQYFFESEKLLNKVKLISESHIMAKTNIGEVYYYKKDYIKAEKYMLEGYKLAKEKNAGRILSSANITLGMIYFDTKKYAESEKYLLEGLRMSKEMNHSDNIISCGLYLGKLYIAQNNVAKGMDLLNSTIQYAKNYEKSKSVWELLYEYGINFYTQNKYDSSAIYFKKAVQLVEEGSQRLFGGAEAKKIYNADYRKVDLYNKLVVSLAKTGNKKDALYYADKSNNQAIKEQIEKAGFSTTDKDKADAIKKGSELLQKKNAVEQAITKEKSKPEKEQNKQLIASLESVKNVAEENYTNFIDSLVTKFQDLSSYFVKANPADFDKYLKKIPENTAVLLYVINDNQLFIFTATNKETSIKIVDLKEDINKTAARFLSILRNPKNVTGTGSIVVRSTLKTSEEDIRGNFKEESSILYNLLITPVKEVLAGKTNICIIPNQKLTSIPFQSLGLVDDNQKFHFLVEDYNIFYTNQLDIFKTDFTPNKIDVSFAIFGNPDKSLPGASSEAKNIAQLYPNSKLFLEDEATEAKAIECLKSFSYVHFATHGVLDYSDFNNSYLVFAENKQLNSDGKLTIKKINGLKLANDIVMLSACETAVSKEAVKGWYISPANAFLRKGAQTLIATLWKISDEATDIVETEFYKNLPNMTRSEALRKAQATLSQNPKYSHPFFWSAFVLYGEWR
jgi:CHAT domain-containing protein